MVYEVVLMDATETLIEHPKKDKSVTTLGRRKDTHWKHNLCR